MNEPFEDLRKRYWVDVSKGLPDRDEHGRFINRGDDRGRDVPDRDTRHEPHTPPILSRFGFTGDDGAELDLQHLLRTLWRRKMVIMGSVFLIVTMTILVVFQLTPQYTSTAKVMIDTRQNQVVDVEAILSGVTVDMATILSEVEILRSRSLVGRVVNSLGLTDDPEFNAELRPRGVFATVLHPSNWLPEEWTSVIFPNSTGNLTPDELEEQKKAKVVDAVISNLSINAVRRSYVMAISFKSEDPRKAALITNTLADHYIVDQLEAKFEATRRATSWLNDRIADIRDKVRASEKAVEAYRGEQGLIEGKDTSVIAQQLSEINTQLILAQGHKAEAEARLRQAEKLVKSVNGVESAVSVLASPLIHRLKEQEAEVLRETSDLSSKYGERHPKMINKRSEVRDLKQKIKFEVANIIKGLKNEVSVAHARYNSLQASLKTIEVKTAAYGRKQVRLRELQREASANQLLFKSFLSRFKETSGQEEIQRADARIISRAEAPVYPTFPKKGLIIALALVGSAFMGVVLVFVLERLDNGFRTGEQIEALTQIPSIGMVPIVTKEATESQIDRYVRVNPSSAVSESIRSIRTSLMLSDVKSPPKIIAITSSVSGEGKTMLALNLARVAASSGQRVIFVDCDLRRPRGHKSLGISNEDSIIELLQGKKAFGDVCKVEKESGMKVIPGKAFHGNPLDVLGSHLMKDFFDGMRKVFDLIVIDAPPALAVSDIKVIGQYADQVIYNVKWDSTPRQVVLAGLREVMDANINLAGVVLTFVNLKKHARYGYGDTAYYYGRYKEYYAE